MHADKQSSQPFPYYPRTIASHLFVHTELTIPHAAQIFLVNFIGLVY